VTNAAAAAAMAFSRKKWFISIFKWNDPPRMARETSGFCDWNGSMKHLSFHPYHLKDTVELGEGGGVGGAAYSLVFLCVSLLFVDLYVFEPCHVSVNIGGI